MRVCNGEDVWIYVVFHRKTQTSPHHDAATTVLRVICSLQHGALFPSSQFRWIVMFRALDVGFLSDKLDAFLAHLRKVAPKI